MVVLVTGTRDFPKKKDFVATLLKIHPEITTVVQNVNNQKTSMVLGNRSEVLFGDGYITEQLGDFSFRISPKAFYQINPIQTEVLYNTTLEFAGLTGKETVIDAYCGTGTIGIFASPKAKKVVGVELNPDAVGRTRKRKAQLRRKYGVLQCGRRRVLGGRRRFKREIRCCYNGSSAQRKHGKVLEIGCKARTENRCVCVLQPRNSCKRFDVSCQKRL